MTTIIEFAAVVAEARPRQYPGWDGFLGTRASLAMDLVVVAMAAVLPILAYSVLQVRRARYTLHRRIQLGLTVALLTAVTLFEIDVRVHGWRERAGEPLSSAVWIALAIHLVFAISTAVLWPTVVVLAVRRFPSPPAPAEHSAVHRRLGRIAALDMTATAVTGWIFYWLAFLA